METYEKDLREEEDFKAKPETITIPVMQEEVHINKTLIETGKIKVIKKVQEENHFVNTPLFHEEIEVKTVEVNQFTDVIPEALRYEGDTMIITVLKEMSVVRTMIEKEIHITKRRLQTTNSQNVPLKREEIIIQNLNPAD